MKEVTIFQLILYFQENKIYIDATSQHGTEYYHDLEKKRVAVNKILQIQNIKLRGVRETAEHCATLDINFQDNSICFDKTKVQYPELSAVQDGILEALDYHIEDYSEAVNLFN